jgi:ribosomal protein S18 acetylase RimI-like enzyme
MPIKNTIGLHNGTLLFGCLLQAASLWKVLDLFTEANQVQLFPQKKSMSEFDMFRIRPYTLSDFDALIRIQSACFPPPFPSELWWNREQIATHIKLFPAGALCAEFNGEIVGSATAHILQWDENQPAHNWSEASDDGYLRNHNPQGNTLYGVDVAVHPAYRGRGIARAFYRARYQLVRDLQLKRFLAGSRLSGYRAYRDKLTPEAYADAVCRGELNDPVVTPQLRAGLVPVRVVRHYLTDEESCDNALLMKWAPT